MTASRRILPLAAAGLFALPACVVSRSETDGPPARVAARTITPAADGPTQFASLIRGPGERVPAHDPDPGVMPRTFAASATEPAPGPDEAHVPPVPEKPLLAPPPPPDPPLVAAVRAYADGRPEEAVGQLNKLDKPNQDLMLQLIPAVVRLSQIDLARTGPNELGHLADPLDAVAKDLAARGPLGLGKVCFCRGGAKEFGRFEPYPDRHAFPPGFPTIELYAEVRNVRCEPTPEGDGYSIKLAVLIQIVDASGALVEFTDHSNRSPIPVLQGVKREVTRTPVRDSFVLFRFPAPPKPGNYAVRLEVREPASGRTIRPGAMIPLRVQ